MKSLIFLILATVQTANSFLAPQNAKESSVVFLRGWFDNFGGGGGSGAGRLEEEVRQMRVAVLSDGNISAC